LKIYGGCSSAG